MLFLILSVVAAVTTILMMIAYKRSTKKFRKPIPPSPPVPKLPIVLRQNFDWPDCVNPFVESHFDAEGYRMYAKYARMADLNSSDYPNTREFTTTQKMAGKRAEHDKWEAGFNNRADVKLGIRMRDLYATVDDTYIKTILCNLWENQLKEIVHHRRGVGIEVDELYQEQIAKLTGIVSALEQRYRDGIVNAMKIHGHFINELHNEMVPVEDMSALSLSNRPVPIGPGCASIPATKTIHSVDPEFNEIYDGVGNVFKWEQR